MSDAIYMVKQLHADVEVYRDGELVLKLDFADTSALAAMLAYAAEEVAKALDEDMADMAAERRAYDDAERQLDCQDELRYDKHGWN